MKTKIDEKFVTTGLNFEGYAIAEYLGVVRGISVRSRSVIGNIGAAIQSFFGGNISLLQELCEQTRKNAFDIMVAHAEELGANAIIGAKYDATEIMQGVSEVLCYGTAVILRKS